MLGATYGTIEDIEIVWTLVALVGLLYSAINTKEAKADVNELEARGIKNGRRFIARAALWSEGARTAIQSIFFLTGLTVLFLPSPPPAADLPLAQVIAGFLIRWGLITSSILLTLKAYLARRVRKELTEE